MEATDALTGQPRREGQDQLVWAEGGIRARPLEDLCGTPEVPWPDPAQLTSSGLTGPARLCPSRSRDPSAQNTILGGPAGGQSALVSQPGVESKIPPQERGGH